MISRSLMVPAFAGLVVATVVGCATRSFEPQTASIGPLSEPDAVELLGVAVVPWGHEVEGSVVGGLSSLVALEDGTILAVSDARASRGGQRAFRLEVDLQTGVEVRVTGKLELTGPHGAPLEASLDPEGLLRTGENLLVSSEAGDDAPMTIGQHDRAGHLTARIDLPTFYTRPADETAGARPNLGLESLAAAPGGRIVAGLENGLVQDGPSPKPGRPALTRLLELDLETPDKGAREYAYALEPVHASPAIPGTLVAAGLVDMLWIDDRRWLALERSFALGVGFSVKLFSVEIDPSAGRAASERSIGDLQPVPKRLVVDLSDLDVPLDNYEGLAWGPRRSDGRRTLLVVSDDNFRREQQTLIVALALTL